MRGRKQYSFVPRFVKDFVRRLGSRRTSMFGGTRRPTFFRGPGGMVGLRAVSSRRAKPKPRPKAKRARARATAATGAFTRGHPFYGNQYVTLGTRGAKRVRGPSAARVVNELGRPMSSRAREIANMSPAEYQRMKKRLGID